MFVLNLNLFRMADTSLSPQKQLQLIEKTIDKAKENLCNYSFDFLFWGWLVFLTASLNFIGLKFTPFEQYSYLIWAITPLMGGIHIANHHRKRAKKKRIVTYLEFFLGKLWIVLGSVMILSGFFSFFINLKPLLFIPVIAGIGTLVSGLVLRFRLLTLGGFLLFCNPFLSQLLPPSWSILLYGIIVFIAFAIPGYVLKSSFNETS